MLALAQWRLVLFARLAGVFSHAVLTAAVSAVTPVVVWYQGVLRFEKRHRQPQLVLGRDQPEACPEQHYPVWEGMPTAAWARPTA